MEISQVQNGNSLLLGAAKSAALGAGATYAGLKCLNSPRFCKLGEEGFFQSALLAEKLGANKSANKLLNVACSFEGKIKQLGTKVNSIMENLKNSEFITKIKSSKFFSSEFCKKASKVLNKMKLNTPTAKFVLMGAGIVAATYLICKGISSLFSSK